MKYCILIIDGAAGLPLPECGGKTCLELAHTPNLDAMTQEGTLGLACTIPSGMELSSSNACMSVLGYDPEAHRLGRAAIEARSMGIPVGDGEVVFRCNLVTIDDGKMRDYSSGHISTGEAQQLIDALNESLGNDSVHFYPGFSYRHIARIIGREDTLLATCTPSHDIPGKPINEFMPDGSGSDLLRDLMKCSEDVLREHPVNVERRSRGESPANMIWLFWGSGGGPDMPAFKQVYGLDGVVTSAVDVIRGLALMMGMGILEILGVTDGLDNDFAGQATGALAALDEFDLAVIHIEATDEAAHAGSIIDKVEAIQRIDNEVVSRLSAWRGDALRVLIMPDHPTPIKIRTHSPDPVPFLLWGEGFIPNGARRFTEAEAAKTGLFIDPGYNIMSRLTGKG
ncbi:cofactor-independent phosphoglycerate mutase [Chloroflexota bacterium]